MAQSLRAHQFAVRRMQQVSFTIEVGSPLSTRHVLFVTAPERSTSSPHILYHPCHCHAPVPHPHRMPLKALRPVGSYVPLMRTPGSAPDLSFGGKYLVHFVDSGTSALAQALLFARSRQPRREPSAIFPGYGCPDLVAASVYAGVKPRLVDTEIDTPWLDPRAVESCIDSVAALVAVNFLGMRERIESLRALAAACDVALIEDSAQMAPLATGTAPTGDLVVYSFGRGKPASLLTGGALLVRRDWAEEFERILPPMPAVPATGASAAKYFAKRLVYNLAITPPAYAVLRKLMFLKLGEVAYHPLTAIEPMNPAAVATLSSAIAALPTQPGEAQRALHELLAPHADRLVDLPAALERAHHPLLRYPVLLKRGDRDDCVRRLEEAGLGASPFYGRTLGRIVGVPGVESADTPNAESFASRLVTLPVHSDVLREHATAMVAALVSASR